MQRRQLAALFSAAFPASTIAQPAPASGPIRLVIPFPPGGASDIVGRILTEQMQARLGRPVIADNRPGASGNIGADIVAKAPPDGTALVLASASTHGINPTLMASMPFDSRRDFTPISLVMMVPSLLVVSAQLPIRSVADLIAYAKANPGTLNYSSSGPGTTQHLAGVMLEQRAGIQMVHVPYRGAGTALPDLITGVTQLSFTNIVAVQGAVETGQLRALAVSLPQRWPTLPDVPTFTEAGVPDFQVSSWLAVLGPAGLPAAITERYSAVLRDAVADPAARQRLLQAGGLPVGSTPAEATRFIDNEITTWGDLIRSAGIRAD